MHTVLGVCGGSIFDRYVDIECLCQVQLDKCVVLCFVCSLVMFVVDVIGEYIAEIHSSICLW